MNFVRFESNAGCRFEKSRRLLFLLQFFAMVTILSRYPIWKSCLENVLCFHCYFKALAPFSWMVVSYNTRNATRITDEITWKMYQPWRMPDGSLFPDSKCYRCQLHIRILTFRTSKLDWSIIVSVIRLTDFISREFGFELICVIYSNLVVSILDVRNVFVKWFF